MEKRKRKEKIERKKILIDEDTQSQVSFIDLWNKIGSSKATPQKNGDTNILNSDLPTSESTPKVSGIKRKGSTVVDSPNKRRKTESEVGPKAFDIRTWFVPTNQIVS